MYILFRVPWLTSWGKTTFLNASEQTSISNQQHRLELKRLQKPQSLQTKFYTEIASPSPHYDYRLAEEQLGKIVNP